MVVMPESQSANTKSTFKVVEKTAVKTRPSLKLSPLDEHTYKTMTSLRKRINQTRRKVEKCTTKKKALKERCAQVNGRYNNLERKHKKSASSCEFSRIKATEIACVKKVQLNKFVI